MGGDGARWVDFVGEYSFCCDYTPGQSVIAPPRLDWVDVSRGDANTLCPVVAMRACLQRRTSLLFIFQRKPPPLRLNG